MSSRLFSHETAPADILSIDISSDDWLFQAEGNIQLVYQYIGENSFLQDKVLKVSKPSFFNSLAEQLAIEADDHCSLSELGLPNDSAFDHSERVGVSNRDESDTKHHLDFIENMIYPWFSSSLKERHYLVLLSVRTLYDLVTSIPLSSLREDTRTKLADLQSRVDDRTVNPHLEPSNILHKCSTQSTVIALLERNLSMVKGSRLASDISIEIKMKCGLTSCSPFITENVIKYDISRCRLMQLFKGRVGSYDPRDLTSTSPSQIREAVHNLIKEKSKHFKLRIRGQHVSDIALLNDTNLGGLSVMSPLLGWPHQLCFDTVLDMICITIERESVYRNLECLQGIDLIDVEGVMAVYHRLRQFTDSNDEALEMISVQMTKLFQSLDRLKAISKYFIELRSILDSNDQVIDDTWLSQLGGKEPCNVSDAKVLELARIILKYRLGRTYHESKSLELQEWVENLTADDCIYTIKLWLVALVAKDTSIITAFNVVPVKPFEGNLCSYTDTNIILVHENLQAEDKPGTIAMLRQSDAGDERVGMIEYSIGLTDICQKFVSKIIEKGVVEDAICRSVADKVKASFSNKKGGDIS
jgi:hypothetical protein